jgi:hypothetical protein
MAKKSLKSALQDNSEQFPTTPIGTWGIRDLKKLASQLNVLNYGHLTKGKLLIEILNKLENRAHSFREVVTVRKQSPNCPALHTQTFSKGFH